MKIEPQAAVASVAPNPESPFSTVMAIWTSWMKLRDEQTSSGWGHPQDSKDFMRTGEAIEVMVNDLPRIQWWAIRKSRGIATVWRFPELSLGDAIAEAEKILTPKMQNHLATRRYFD